MFTLTATRRNVLLALGAVTLGLMATHASAAPLTNNAATPAIRYFVVQPHAGIFIPTKAETRAVFGDARGTAGIAIDLVQQQLCPEHTISLRLDSTLLKTNDDHLYLVPIGVRYTKFLNNSDRVRPYVAAGASLCYVDLEVRQQGIDETKITFMPTFTAGVQIGQRGFVEATYLTTERIEGFDICGTKIAAGLSF